jgi:elongation factor 3
MNTGGRRYGVCGANGAGKSTLLKAIDKHQIDGFPENVSTFYVQHDIDGVTDDISVLNFMIADKKVLAVQADEKRIKDTLTEMGFDDDRQATPVGALSGGWKMR